MVSQKYDRKAIQASPDLSPGDTHPNLVEVQNYRYLNKNQAQTSPKLAL